MRLLCSGDIEDAYAFAQKCLEFADTKEVGKAILKDIAGRRGKAEEKEAEMDVGGASAASGSAARMRANSDGDDDDDEEEEDGIGRRPQRTGRRDLEPMNLTFDTP